MATWKNLVRNTFPKFYRKVVHFRFFLEEAMASVNQICSDHNIDLDDESEAPESQTIRNNLFDFEDEIDLDEICGMFRLEDLPHISDFLIL